MTEAGSDVWRVATYNIRSLRDDGGAVARVLRAIDPDVVCIQEAPRFLFSRRTCRRLARAAGLSIVGGGRSAAANLLLARDSVEVIRTKSVLLSKDRGLHQRGAAFVHLRRGTAGLAVAGTHLDGVEAPRLRHIRELESAVEAFVPPATPLVVAGDINDQPDSRSWNLLTARWSDAFAVAGRGDGLTSTPLEPTRRIDAIFTSPEVEVLSCTTPDGEDVRRASDHRPVVAEVRVGNR